MNADEAGCGCWGVGDSTVDLRALLRGGIEIPKALVTTAGRGRAEIPKAPVAWPQENSKFKIRQIG